MQYPITNFFKNFRTHSLFDLRVLSDLAGFAFLEQVIETGHQNDLVLFSVAFVRLFPLVPGGIWVAPGYRDFRIKPRPEHPVC